MQYRKMADYPRQETLMLKSLSIAAAIIGLTASLTACNSPGERAVGGALIGGGGGALVGGALGGGRGALIGAGIGAAGGAIVGASTAPRPYYGYPERVYAEPRRPRGCPYGAYEDEYGNVYCR
jgi:osmotically inducible lipoprotein OsmB